MNEDDPIAAVSNVGEDRQKFLLGGAVYAHLVTTVLVVIGSALLPLGKVTGELPLGLVEAGATGAMFGIGLMVPLCIAYGPKSLMVRLSIVMAIVLILLSITGFWQSTRSRWLIELTHIHIALLEATALFYAFRVAGLQLYRETSTADKPANPGFSIAALMELTLVVAVIFGLQRYRVFQGETGPWQFHLFVPGFALIATLPCALWLFSFKSVLRRFFLVYGVMAVLTAIVLTTAAYTPQLVPGRFSSIEMQQYCVLISTTCSVLSIFMLILRFNRYRLRWGWCS